MKQLVSFFFAIFLTSNHIAIAGEQSRLDPVQRRLSELTELFPKQAKRFELTAPKMWQSIPGIALGSGAREHLVVAGFHGNEVTGVSVAMELASSLAQEPLAGEKIYIIPVMSLRGFEENRRFDFSEIKKDYVNPNRDYPGPCHTDHQPLLGSTSALLKFLQSHQKILSFATLHSYRPIVAYPWLTRGSQAATEEEEAFERLARAATQWSGYSIGNGNRAVYPVNGTAEDFIFWKYGIWSLLFELGTRHAPDPEEMSGIISKNVKGLRSFFKAVPNRRALKHAYLGECDPRSDYTDINE